MAAKNRTVEVIICLGKCTETASDSCGMRKTPVRRQTPRTNLQQRQKTVLEISYLLLQGASGGSGGTGTVWSRGREQVNRCAAEFWMYWSLFRTQRGFILHLQLSALRAKRRARIILNCAELYSKVGLSHLKTLITSGRVWEHVRQTSGSFLGGRHSSLVHNKTFLYARARPSNLTHMSLRHMTACAHWRGRAGGERAAGQRILSNLSRHSCEMRLLQPSGFLSQPIASQ